MGERKHQISTLAPALAEIRTPGGSILGSTFANKHGVFMALISSNRKNIFVVKFTQNDDGLLINGGIWNFIYPNFNSLPMPIIIWLKGLRNDVNMQDVPDVEFPKLYEWIPFLGVFHQSLLEEVNICNSSVQQLKATILNALTRLHQYLDGYSSDYLFPSLVTKLNNNYVDAYQIADETEGRMLEISKFPLLIVDGNLDIKEMKSTIIKWTFKCFSALNELEKTQIGLEGLILTCSSFSNTLDQTVQLQPQELVQSS